jgi:Cytochrome c7 and related cytochrome c
MSDEPRKPNLVGRIRALPGSLRSSNWSERLKNLVKRPLFIAAVGAMMVLVLCAATYGIWLLQQPPEQPIQFNHSVHIGYGVQCLYCHPGAWKGVSAGIPTQSKCWGCHQQIPIKNEDQQKLKDAVLNNQPIEWVPVFIMPDFVYFNHRPHIAAGLNCEDCHGELSQMTVAEPRKNANMGWCLRCHRTRAADDEALLTRLTDCGTCHR